jgi:alpha-L-fucosidase 2
MERTCRSRPMPGATPELPFSFMRNLLLAVRPLVLGSLLVGTGWASPVPLTLWYDQPGRSVDGVPATPDKPAVPPRSPLTEGLPIGNGRIGALIMGDPAQEAIVLNEISLWTGTDNPTGAYGAEFGSYQTLGQIVFTPQAAPATPSDYRRELDLNTATARVGYRIGDTAYRHEYFASHPAGVMVFRFTAEGGSYSGTLAFADGHQAPSRAEGRRLTSTGALSNGLRYETQILLQADGGTVEVADGKWLLHDCRAFTLIVGAGTDYVIDPQRHFRGDDPHAQVTRQVDAAAAISYEELQKAHAADYRALFARVSYDFGPSTPEQRALPFDQRKVAAAKTADPELEALFAQYGRYLLISCSRPGSLPANLQGLWNDTNTPKWDSDYHTDINIQMNYWAAEVPNLAECGVPFFDYVESQVPSWRQFSTAEPTLALPDHAPLRGFAVRTSLNPFGGMGWHWDLPANAWLAQHFWERYAFGGDREWLRADGYPYLKEVCHYWEDHLKALPDGRLVVPNVWSPEHGPIEDGVSYAQQILWDLFTNSAQAAAILGDADNAQKWTSLAGRLAKPGTGSWGQLLEWMQEKKGAGALDTRQDHHRHTSHLFAVYPGHQISPAQTPELAKAAAVSLAARGDEGDVREWSFAWRAALWARLGDGEAAHRQLQQMFSDRNTCLNLFGLHPPMQIDGNLGFAGTIPEMLLQSQDGDLVLLPALPSAWPTGAVTGLRARGGFEVDLQWKDGHLVGGTIRSTWGTACRLRHGDKIAELQLLPGHSQPLPPSL